MSNFVDVGLRDLVKRGYLPGPDVLATGYHVRPQPAAEAFLEAPELGDLMGGLTTTDALRRFVRFNLSRNVDWIKVLATERAGTPDTDPRKQVYTEAELTVIVAEAAARGVPVLAHAHGAEGALAAVKAGVRSIEHGTYLTDETLTLMAQRGVFFDPTADVVNDLAMPGGDYDHAGLQRRGQMMKPVLAALQSATTVNAELLNMQTQIGPVQPRALLDPLLVISNGRVALDRLSFGK